jgi:ankyrin repeat protein
VDEVRKLLDAGADPTSRDDRSSAVHLAAASGQVKVLEVLAAAGANLDVLDQDDATPLMAACIRGLQRGSRGALKLIELGAKVGYVRRSDGANAMEFAVTRATGEVLEALIARGAAIDGRVRDPITPLMRAAIEGNLVSVRVLVARGADVGRKCGLDWGRGKTAAELARDNRKTAVADFLERTHRSAGVRTGRKMAAIRDRRR